MASALQGQAIYVVDDEASVRDALTVVLSLEGCTVSAFDTGEAFLDAMAHRRPACVLLDVHMPGRSGIDILKTLNAHHYPAPIFIISGQGDIPTAVAAIKAGAFDFIEKPFDGDLVVARISEALSAHAARSGGGPAVAANFAGRDLLTPRELDVLGQIVGGASNKEAGRHLGISPRTIEVHRARIMEKLGAKNAADLVRLVLS